MDVHHDRGILFRSRRRAIPRLRAACRLALAKDVELQAVNLADSLDGRTSALTVSDIAELLNISERQVYKLAAENGIPSFKIGGSVRFDPAAFAAWLRHKMGPASVDANGRQRARRA
jgi:excisionase family DNA binding protein